MTKQATYTIFDSAEQLPKEWDMLAEKNIFLSIAYLTVLETSAPKNLEAHFIGLFKEGALCGIAVSQYINLSGLDAFVKKQRGLKQYLFKKYASHALVLGNNMLTGQNAYLLNDVLAETEGLQLFEAALLDLKKSYSRKGIGINLLLLKDFNNDEWPALDSAGYKGYYRFFTQPNMVFDVRPEWHGFEDYLADLNTKYRTQHNRARKKAAGIEVRELSPEEVKEHSQSIQSLYLTVAGNASFNTFYLPDNHFYVLKKMLHSRFLFFGYFVKEKLVGFNTLIKNGPDTDTYFLGYDAAVQKEKMLYLNMLYDMAAYSINNGFKQVIYGRSAMEIKSSVGVRAEKVYGLIKHTNPIINPFMAQLFRLFDPEIEWKERKPFKH